MQNLQCNSTDLEGKIRAEAFRLGFSLCGFTSPAPPAQYDRYEAWLSNKQHAGMVYLESNRHRMVRQHPDQLMAGVKTIISLAWLYSLQQIPDHELPNLVKIAGYVDGSDYHQSLPAKMDELVAFIQNELGFKIQAQAFTDSAPILEREIASRAGLGWIGKNSCLISPEIGSAFLLAELFIDQPLQIDQPFEKDHCGTCHHCIDACPTHCIQPDRTVDSSRCISYLTIENKVGIPEELRPNLGNWLFGCDICQSICPWNRKPVKLSSPQEHPEWTQQDLSTLLSMSPETFAVRFKGSSLFRSKLRGLQRNALVWLGNNGKADNVTLIDAYINQVDDKELIEIAEWAKNQLHVR